MKTVREKRERLAAIAGALTEIYPDATCALRYAGDPWRLLVMGRLSAQCTDARVNLVSEELFRAYPTPAAMAAAPIAEIERLVKPCGLYHTKAENIRDASAMLVSEYGGELPRTMEELLRFPGVGRKIANLLLGDIFGAPAVVTDTHCIRICGRLGMYPETERDPYRVEKTLVGLIDPAISADFCHRIVQFGRDVCTARAPKCATCPLAEQGLCERHLRESRAAAKAAARETEERAGAGKTVETGKPLKSGKTAGAGKPLKAGKTVGAGAAKPLKTGKNAKTVQPAASAGAPKATGGKRANSPGTSSANAAPDGQNGK